MSDTPKQRIPRVLIADDDEFIRELVSSLVCKSCDVDPVYASDGAVAMASLDDPLDAAIVDLDMPGASGLDVLMRARSSQPGLPVIILSGAGDVDAAVLALKRGAFDYITKPFDPDALVARVREALRVSHLESENAALRMSGSDSREPVQMIAESPSSLELMKHAERCARVDSTVLISGPSGTGKSMLARWIHQHSTRRKGPFVSVNCGSLPHSLIESEVFGHEKGAFTGATGVRIGRFEVAHSGTLFLDEIGELPLDLQPKLLGALQDRVITRVGSTQERRVDVRIIAATNADLEQSVAERTFREDLFFRLNVLRLHVPALQGRAEDIGPLAAHIVARLSRRLGIRAPEVSADALRMLETHAWPGNIRELENVLERAIVFGTGGRISSEDLGSFPRVRHGSIGDVLAGMTLEAIERMAIRGALQAHGGNRASAARALGVSERTIYNRIRTYGLDAESE